MKLKRHTKTKLLEISKNQKMLKNSKMNLNCKNYQGSSMALILMKQIKLFKIN